MAGIVVGVDFGLSWWFVAEAIAMQGADRVDRACQVGQKHLMWILIVDCGEADPQR